MERLVVLGPHHGDGHAGIRLHLTSKTSHAAPDDRLVLRDFNYTNWFWGRGVGEDEDEDEDEHTHKHTHVHYINSHTLMLRGISQMFTVNDREDVDCTSIIKALQSEASALLYLSMKSFLPYLINY